MSEGEPGGALDAPGTATEEAQVLDLGALLLVLALFVGALALMALMAPR